MEGGREKQARQNGKRAVQTHTTTTTVVNSPSHTSNSVVQTGAASSTTRNETDLQRAITDYQTKTHKNGKPVKSKNTATRAHQKSNNHNEIKYGAPISQARLADTYMVGGCQMDLNNSSSSYKKAAMMFNQHSTSSTKQATAGLISHHQNAPHRNQHQVRSRVQNTNPKSGGSTGPMQLEPNPVFSIIDEQMDKMNKHTKDRDSNYGASYQNSLAASQNSEIDQQKLQHNVQKEKPLDYVSFVDGSNVMQLQKIAMQSSFEGRAASETFGMEQEDNDHIVAYSGKRRQVKNSKTIGRKVSPKRSAFFNNSTANEMSNVWSKYRRNMHDAFQKSTEQHGVQRKAQSVSRQDYLMQQHKQNQMMQLQVMKEKVTQYQKKLVNEMQNVQQQQPQADQFSMRNSKHKERLSKSIGRDTYAASQRTGNLLLNESGKAKHKHPKQMATDVNNSKEDDLINGNFEEFGSMRYDTTDDREREITRSSMQTDKDSVSKKNNNSQLGMTYNNTSNGNGSKLQQHSSGKNSALNGKVSTSIKATWTVNRTSYGNTASRLANQQINENGVDMQSSQASSDRKQNSRSQLQDHQPSSSSQQQQPPGQLIIDSNPKQRHSRANQINQDLLNTTSDVSNMGQAQVMGMNNSVTSGQTSPHVVIKQVGINASNHVSVTQRKKPPGSSNYQQVVSSTFQASQLANRRRFMKDGTMGSGQLKGQIVVQATRNGATQEVITSPVQLRQNDKYSGPHSGTNDPSVLKLQSPMSSSKQPTKSTRRKSAGKQFEQLMNVGSQLSPTKMPSTSQNESVDAKRGGEKNTPVQKEFVFNDPGVKIGNGKFGPVNLIIHQGKLYALKVIPKTTIAQTKRIEHVKNEKNILKMLRKNQARNTFGLTSGASQRANNSRNLKRDETENDAGEFESASSSNSKEPLDFIMMLFETFTDAENVNFVFEYLPGQDLFWILQNEHNLNLGKDKQRKDWVLFYCAEILCALETLHSREIIYRDMKPDNVMIDYEGHIKLIDFGFSKVLSERHNYRTRTNCGTIGYTAPEILLGVTQGYGFSVDIWSFGIMLAELLSGSLPFLEKDDPMKLQEQILAGQLRLNKEGIDSTARDFLNQIFQSDSEMRPSIDTLKKHKLFTQDKPVDYWSKIQAKTAQEVPYKPNPMKYSYLLQNEYPLVSNLTNKANTQVASREGNLDRNLMEASDEREVSPAPNFGGRDQANTSALSANQYKIGDPIGRKEKRPTNMERERNVGMFGQGIGNTDKGGHLKIGQAQFDQQPAGISPGIGKKKHQSLLGDFTLYRVNKEFENF